MLLERDVTGRIVESLSKTSKSFEIDGNKRFCGKRFALGGKIYGDKKCMYCGTWFHWQQTDKHKWIAEANIDTYNVDTNIEPLHCGTAKCRDYHYLSLQAAERKAHEAELELERRGLEIYKQLKKVGML